MAFSVAKGSFTAPTSAATDTTVSGLSFQPKAIIFFATLATADGYVVDQGFSFGFASGTATTAQCAVGCNSDDNVGTSDTAQEVYDGVLAIPNTAGSAALWAAQLKTINSDGFVLDWIAVGATGILVHYLALGGSDLTNAEVARFTANTSNGSQTVNTGFQGDFLLMIGNGRTSVSRGAQGRIDMGCATSSSARWAAAFNSVDAQTMAANINAASHQRTDACYLGVTTTSSEEANADFTSFNATPSFTINWINAPSAASHLGYLLLKGGQYSVGAFNKTTSAAPVNQDVTAPGFQPTGLLLASFNEAATSSVTADAQLSIGAGDGTNEGSAWSQTKDTITTEANAAIVATKALRLAESPTTTNSEADHSFISGGFRLAWTTNLTSVADQILYAAFGSTAAPATSGTAVMAARGLVAAPTYEKAGTTTLAPRSAAVAATVPSKPVAGTADFTTISGQSLTPSLPTGWQPDDVHILLFAHKAGATMASLSGWTQIQAQTNGTALRAEVWWRRAQSGDSAPTVSLVNNAVTTVRGARIVGIRGCPEPDDPFDGGSIQNNGSSSTVAFDDITTSTENDFVLALVAYASDPTDVSTMSGFTEPADAVSSFDADPFGDDTRVLGDADNVLGDGGSGDAMLGYEWRAVTTPGAAGATSLTVSGGTFSSAISLGILLAIKTNVAGAAPSTSGTAAAYLRGLLNGSGSAAEIADTAPSGDVAVATWTTETGSATDLYASIDEPAVDDTDYIRSPASPSSPTECTIRVAPMAEPEADEELYIAYRYGKDYADGDRIDLTVTLYAADGTTEVASWSHPDLPDELVSTEQLVTPAQRATIPSADYATGLVLGFRAETI